ncbi:hypothetical protein COCSUDRAFT_40099 [Coccomyxa subellipsoidea C-169]|uniref:Uncharacterized protein n=1 Tax=Coccomyxa subellipsoidea (strain C-169) TaxID=574566 RepID=I0Z5C8_COCSC|nr:hypothetical protein COCSUDRAFT_40099 [Coccomyxa subellipsoidea C-169]EIE25847.1 hypothetical protein COCSUDRAFT_40099 [Coccomyxa subellipsoidea C-169]|eukprot:XP_005650391.1 hypothetical protein COCSUDRAFT_40099 [Coccomyxa subellipsoidea C-169]
MTPVDLQPKKKPSVEALWRQFFAEPGSFQDLRPKKEGIAKRPDFKHSESGLVLWLNTAPDWVLKRKEEEPLEAYLQDDQSIPSKPRVEVGGANAADERGPREREDVSWTEELIRAVKNPLLGELVDDATDEADPPEGCFRKGEELLRHQKRGLAWMLKREKLQPAGGILADDQGVGKTLTALALVVSDPRGPLPVEQPPAESEDVAEEDDTLKAAPSPAGGTLILCPKSTLHSTWLAEIKRRLAKHWTVYVYAGKDRLAITAEKLAAFDIVLATPETMLMDSPLKTQKALHQVAWHRVIIDEAQSIKNHRSHRSAAAALLQGQKRWVMSGTPLQNSPEELISYFVFLGYKPFNSRAAFAKLMREAVVVEEGQRSLNRLRRILAPIMLRRTKQSCIDGTPIVQLPGRQMRKVAIEFSAEERLHYEELTGETQEESEQESNTAFLLSKLRRLQMACNHPSLQAARAQQKQQQQQREPVCNGDTWQCSLCGKPAAYRLPCTHLFCVDCQEWSPRVEQECQVCARTGMLELVEGSSVEPHLRHLSSAKLEYLRHAALEAAADREQLLVFSLWTATLDLLEPILAAEGVPFCRLDGGMTEAARADNIARFCGDRDNTVFLISTMAGGTGLNLPAASRVVLVEPFWNPYLEEQAISRADRIGQTRVVQVFKLYVPGTVEERIFELQEWKRRVVEGIIGQADLGSAASAKLTKHEMEFLMGRQESVEPSSSEGVSQRPQIITKPESTTGEDIALPN